MNTAMILAAGRGERLKPLTNYLPKAMSLVKGKPVIEYHLLNLAKAGFNKVVINHAYLGGQLRRYLGDGNKWGLEICYTPEPPGALETGGGIFNALPLLGKKPFIIINADLFSDFDFSACVLPSHSLANLILVEPNSSKKDFGLAKSGKLTNETVYTYTGIACLHPDFFYDAKPGRYSIVPLFKNLINKNLATGCLHKGFWFDVGTQNGLQAANFCC